MMDYGSMYLCLKSITELQCDAGVETNSTAASEPMNSKSPTTFTLKTK